MSKKYLTATEENFSAIIEGDKPVMVDFWASWCGPCMMLIPVVEELASDYEGRAVVAKCNVDECSQLAEQFGIMSIPTLLFFKNGALAETVVGFRSKDQLSAVLDKYL